MSIPLDAEVADLRSHQDGCKEEGFPYSKKHMEDVDLIVAACNNYQEALDHIERLQKRVDELEKENNRISVLLHDEMSQLELTIDLSNKRWTALNNIYTDGEKHNANWCKRKAQEGLGIK